MFFFKKPAPTGLSIADAVQRAKNGDLVLVDVREHEEVAPTAHARQERRQRHLEARAG